ncbi:hypothetical protein ACWEPH_21700 [Nocardia beijingensis]
MTFAYFGDEFYPQFIRVHQLSARALGVFFGLVLDTIPRANDGITDDLSVSLVTASLGVRRRKAVIDELISAGLVTKIGDGRYQLYWEHQKTAAQIARTAEQNRVRTADFRERDSRCKAGDHTLCEGTKRACQGKVSGRRNAVSATPQSNPFQSVPAKDKDLDKDCSFSTDETDSALARSTARGSSSPGSGSGAPDVGSASPWAGEDEDFDFDDWLTDDVSGEVFEQALERELQLVEKRYRAVPDSVEFKIKGTMIEARLVEPLWRVVKNRETATPYDMARVDAAEEVVQAVFGDFPGVEWDEESCFEFPYRARITTTRRSGIVHDLEALLSEKSRTCAERKRESRAVEKAMSELAALPVDAATITEAGAMVGVKREGLWVHIRFAGRLPQLWRAFMDTGDLPAHDRQLLAAAARIRRSFSVPPTPDDDYDWTVSLIGDGQAGIEDEIRGRVDEALEQARREAEVGVG